MRSLAILLLLATPAIAQEISFSPEATEACVAAAEDALGRMGCVGRSADACIEGPGGESNAGIGACLVAERDFWEGHRERALGALVEIETRNSEELASLGSAAPSSIEALRAMDGAWIAWRDAACAYEVSQWGGGSGGGPAEAQCLMRMTGRQALALEDRLKAATGP
ncbi:MAG TPA: lysozyme inhibitor LprI family protein [Amaricoccus sp.]|jgi:uncharacterized protein YecT (DUF1311 family)|nr:lysozyme inhibitor LprI family protein [Amaricoccus sp.]